MIALTILILYHYSLENTIVRAMDNIERIVNFGIVGLANITTTCKTSLHRELVDISTLLVLRLPLVFWFS